MDFSDFEYKLNKKLAMENQTKLNILKKLLKTEKHDLEFWQENYDKAQTKYIDKYLADNLMKYATYVTECKIKIQAYQNLLDKIQATVHAGIENDNSF